MRTLFIILALFLLSSCKRANIPEESSFIFKLPEKEIFVKTTKYKGGKFALFFATDSLMFSENKDFVQFPTGDDIRAVVDSNTIYIGTYLYPSIKIESGHFNIQDVSKNIFQDPFLQNPVSTVIRIYTKEYHIIVDTITVKEGNVYGGW